MAGQRVCLKGLLEEVFLPGKFLRFISYFRQIQF